ncbi:MAG TPA: cupin domain-containing protein [Propionibacteriaceae bacterium]|nr:cupin domain-containing protein [Propionibacteriaceae bacterium]
MGTAQTLSDRVGEVLVRAPGDGPATWAMGSLFERLASAAETDGALGVSLLTQPPGVATPLHVHTREAEAFFLLDGTMNYQAGDTLYRLSAGYFIYLPKGVPHAFRITGTSPVRFLGLTVPGGLMDLYDEVGMPAAERRLPGSDGPPVEEEIRRWNEVSPRYGLRVVGPPIPSET